MCGAKPAKVQQPAAPPKPTIIRNAYLDGTDPTLRAAREGVSALKIARTLPSAGYIAKGG